MSSPTHQDVVKASISWLYKPFCSLIVCELTDSSWSNRMDVVALTPNEKRIRVVECKASRSDFLAGRGKFEVYMKYCHQFYVAAPLGIVDPSELPPGVGLIEVGKNGWKRLKKRALIREMSPEMYTQMLERCVQKLVVERSLPPWDKRVQTFPPPHQVDACPRRHLDPFTGVA